MGDPAGVAEETHPRDILGRIYYWIGVRPGSVALRTLSDSGITYAELAQGLAQMEDALRRAGLRPGDTVAIGIPRSHLLCLTVLAALSCRLPIVPISPQTSDEHLENLGRMLNVRAAVFAGGGADPLDIRITSPSTAERAATASERAHLAGRFPGQHVDEAIAFIYHTSGSTGQPKGVAVSHESLDARIHELDSRFPMVPGDAVPLKCQFTFDVFLWELLGPLVAGATVDVVPPGRESDPQYLASVLKQEDIRAVHFVPTMLDQYLLSVPSAHYPGLRWLCTSGEAMRRETLRRLDTHFPASVEYHNLYGQTETSEVLGWSGRNCEESFVPLGRPMGAYDVVVVDEEGIAAPVGATGELWILADSGISPGYVGTSMRTAPAHQSPESGDFASRRLYRSGDFGVRDAEGVIHFRGRRDDQRKCNGIRVDLNSVDDALLRSEGVRDALTDVITLPSGSQQLVSWVLGDVDVTDVARAIAGRLPEHLRPSRIVLVDKWPRTTSGKRDRAALVSRVIVGAGPTADEALEWWCMAGADPGAPNGMTLLEAGGTSLGALALCRVLAERSGRTVSQQECLDATLPRLREWITGVARV